MKIYIDIQIYTDVYIHIYISLGLIRGETGLSVKLSEAHNNDSDSHDKNQEGSEPRFD